MSSEAIRPIGMLRFGFLVSSAAVDTASKPTYAKKIEAAAPSTPAPPSGLPQPPGRNGSRLPVLAAGTASATNTVSATILIATSTALTLALLEVPITSSQVTAMPMRNASRLKPPPE